MPDGPYLTPDEESLQRMLAEGGTPEGAAWSLIGRLEALEEAVASLEAQAADAPDVESGAAASPEEAAEQVSEREGEP